MNTNSLAAVSFALILVAVPVNAETSDAETFDTSGLPAQPTTFLEQQIAELVAYHQLGDLVEAAVIQRKLARYYMEVGDSSRAKTAEDRARLAEQVRAQPAEQVRDEREGRNARADVEPEPTEPIPGGFNGSYYLQYSTALMHMWQFSNTGSYTFTVVSRGYKTSTRTAERGRYEVSNKQIVLRPASTVGGYATPTISGNGTLIGGGTDGGGSTRQLSFQLLGTGGRDGIILNGEKYAPKRW